MAISETETFECMFCNAVMSNYVKAFRLDNKSIINHFLNDFIDSEKIVTESKDYVETFQLVNEKPVVTQYLVSRFVNDFCHVNIIDKYLEAKQSEIERLKLEGELGLMNLREEHERWMLKLERWKLERGWDAKHGRPN